MKEKEPQQRISEDPACLFQMRFGRSPQKSLTDVWQAQAVAQPSRGSSQVGKYPAKPHFQSSRGVTRHQHRLLQKSRP
jgi:hypothetical protein